VPDPGDGHQFKDPQFDAKVLKLMGRKVTPHEKSKQMPGDVGQVVFTLEAVGAGKTELAVHFFNPKEKNQEPMEMLKVNVEVTK
jgi:predicted secreted protein